MMMNELTRPKQTRSVRYVKVFISWSGMQSRVIAEALRGWLPLVIHPTEPWMSAEDLDKGDVYVVEIISHLKDADVGIVCLTPQNIEAPWIMFEAGALASLLDGRCLCTFLFDIDPSRLRGPLRSFQATMAMKEDTKKLIHKINRILGDDRRPETTVDLLFELLWPRLEERLKDAKTFR